MIVEVRSLSIYLVKHTGLFGRIVCANIVCFTYTMNPTAIRQDRLSTIEGRIEILDRISRDENVRACISDAHWCLEAAASGRPYPIGDGDNAERWLDAAEQWVARAGQHAFGYNLPKGW